MRRYFCCFLGVILLTVGAAWFVSATRRLSITNDFDTILITKMEMARELPPDAIVILGDSLAVAHFVPGHLGTNVINLGVEQSSCLEALRFTQIMLAGPRPPRAVIISLARWHITAEDLTFFPVGSRVGLYDSALLEDIRVHARHFRDPLPGLESPLDIDYRLTMALKAARFPSFFFPSVLRVLTGEKAKSNQRIREETLASCGYKHGPDTDGYPHAIKVDPHFIPLPLQEAFFTEMLTLLQRQNIPVYYADGPVNDLTALTIPQEFREEQSRFLKSFEARFPNFHVLGETLPQRPWRDFSDGVHLKSAAAARYSDRMGDLLHAALSER